MKEQLGMGQKIGAGQSAAVAAVATSGLAVGREAVKNACQNVEDKIESKVEKIEERIDRHREKRQLRALQAAPEAEAVSEREKALAGTMKWVMNGSTVVGLILMGLFAWYCYKQGIFQSQEALENFLNSFGFWAPFIFTLVQGIQVVVPVLPGAIGCLAGVLVFGPVWGFVYNYIGICAGSICAFLLARRYGAPFVRSISNPRTYEKYVGWLEKGNRFDKFFALAIFFPVAPDDFLCYLAGLTRMSLKKMTLIILLGKPASIALYSLGLYTIGLKALSLFQ